MQDQRRVPDCLSDLRKPLEIYSYLALVKAMRCADRDCQSINFSLGYKAQGIFRASVEANLIVAGRFVVMCDVAEFAFNRNAVPVGQFNYPARLATVFAKRKFGAIKHDGAVTGVDAARREFKTSAMIQM